MFNAKARYVLLAIFFIGTVVCLFYKEDSLASLGALFFAFLLWSHFKQSSVLLASKHFKNSNYSEAEKALKEVPNPDLLVRNRRGYYEFITASIALKKHDFDEAERHFQIASRFPLNGRNDKAFIFIHLANLALRKKEKERTLAYIKLAKELALTPKAQDIINKIEIEATSL